MDSSSCLISRNTTPPLIFILDQNLTKLSEGQKPISKVKPISVSL